MILLPLGRDNAVIQRHAWVTYGIIGLYFVTFVFIGISHASHQRQYVGDVEAISLMMEKYPFLELPTQLEVILGKAKFQEIVANRPAALQYGYNHQQANNIQKRFDDLAVDAVDHYRKLGQLTWTYVPGESSMAKIFIAMWVQFGLFTLIIECLVLFSTGPYLEDAYGRPAFAMLYFAGAFTAAMVYAALLPHPQYGISGAIGAISAVLGAFLVRFFNSRIEFLWIPIFWRPEWRYRFFVPAWVVIPLWALLQLWALSKGMVAGASSNLAALALGAFFAVGLKLVNYEQVYVAPVVAKETTWTMNENLAKAVAAREWDATEMRTELATYLRTPGTHEEEIRVALELIPAALPDSDADFAGRAAAFADKHKAWDVATLAYDRVCQLAPDSPTTVRHLMRLGTLKKQGGDVIGARVALMRAKAHSACSAEVRATIEARLAQLPA